MEVHSLPADSYDGKVGDVEIKWGPSAQAALEKDAANLNVDKLGLKAVTERLAYNSAVRLDKTGIKILGSFHNTTTVTGTGEVRAHPLHMTMMLKPGKPKVHIYADMNGGLDTLTVTGESVVLSGKTVPDAALSTGTYPTSK